MTPAVAGAASTDAFITQLTNSSVGSQGRYAITLLETRCIHLVGQRHHALRRHHRDRRLPRSRSRQDRVRRQARAAGERRLLTAHVIDATFPSGLFALHASSLDTGGVTVNFDNFRIWSTPPAS